jgi:ribonuclease D
MPSDGPPPPNRWADRDPDAAARLVAARAALADLSVRLSIPVENLLSPELVRRLAWSPPADPSPTGIGAALATGGARHWQVELTAPLLADAVKATASVVTDQ